MSRIKPIELAQAGGKAKRLLDGVQAKLGMAPNMMKTMAQSPAVLEAYLNFAGALGRGALDAKVREQIALVVGQALVQTRGWRAMMKRCNGSSRSKICSKAGTSTDRSSFCA